MSGSERNVSCMLSETVLMKSLTTKRLLVVNIWASAPIVLMVVFIEEPHFLTLDVFVCSSMKPSKARRNLIRDSTATLTLTLDANSPSTSSCQLPRRVASPPNDTSLQRHCL